MRLNDQTLYAADGTRIAFGVTGRGPALVLHNGLCTDTSFWLYLLPIWKERYTVVTWDYPGHGESGLACTDEGVSIEAQAQIVRRLLDVAGIERAAQVGFSMGCQVALEVYRQLPSRVSALGLVLGPAEHVLSSTALPIPAPLLSAVFRYTPRRIFAAGFRSLSGLTRLPFGLTLGRRLGLVGSVSDADMDAVTRHFTMLDPTCVQLMGQSGERHSASQLLRGCRVPLLIVVGERDPFAPAASVGLAMHRAAPGSVLLRLPEGTHTALLDHPQQIDTALAQLLSAREIASA